MSAESLWKGGKHGQLSPWSKAQVFGMHIMAKKKGLKITNVEISAEVWKVGMVNKNVWTHLGQNGDEQVMETAAKQAPWKT